MCAAHRVAMVRCSGLQWPPSPKHPSSSSQEQSSQPTETAVTFKNGDCLNVSPKPALERAKILPSPNQPGGGLTKSVPPGHTDAHAMQMLQSGRLSGFDHHLSRSVPVWQPDLSVRTDVPRHPSRTASESMRLSSAVHVHAVFLQQRCRLPGVGDYLSRRLPRR